MGCRPESATIVGVSMYERYVSTIAEGESPERLVFFSDAVFAIAMTLLVVELKIPEVENAQLGSALAGLGPEYLSFVLSFTVIGAVWMSHHRKFRAIVGYTQTLVRLNLVMLLAVASLPFSTAVLGRYGDSAVSVYIYATTISVIGLLMTTMWWYAWHRGLVAETVTPAVFRFVLVQSLSIPVIFLLSLVVAAFAGATAAELSWIAALPISLINTRVYRARSDRAARGKPIEKSTPHKERSTR
jgi:TMEM175 potassium channel family protein